MKLSGRRFAVSCTAVLLSTAMISTSVYALPIVGGNQTITEAPVAAAEAGEGLPAPAGSLTDVGDIGFITSSTEAQEMDVERLREVKALPTDETSLPGAAVSDESGSAVTAELLESSLLLAKKLRRLADNSKFDLAICRVGGFVNIRSSIGTEGEKVGKIYNNAVATILETSYAEDGTWYKIESGSVIGWIKAEFFVTGAEALELYDEVTTRWAVINVDSLRLRTEANTTSDTLTILTADQQYEVVQTGAEYTRIRMSDTVSGYVATEYIDIVTDAVKAISIEEEQALIETSRRILNEQREREEERVRESESRRKASEEASRKAAEDASRRATTAPPRTTTSGGGGDNGGGTGGGYTPPEIPNTSEVRQSLVAKACSYVGILDYVWGGTSLTKGADCSGFVQSIFKLYGISVPRVSGDQGRYGLKVSSLSAARPGDVIHYDGHVAIYIGNGQIVHAPDRGKKVSISSATYRSICCIRNFFGD